VHTNTLCIDAHLLRAWPPAIESTQALRRVLRLAFFLRDTLKQWVVAYRGLDATFQTRQLVAGVNSEM
jgi:hypothetical protein